MLTVGITLVVAYSLAAAPDTGALTGHFRGEAAVVKGDASSISGITHAPGRELS